MGIFYEIFKTPAKRCKRVYVEGGLLSHYTQVNGPFPSATSLLIGVHHPPAIFHQYSIFHQYLPSV